MVFPHAADGLAGEVEIGCMETLVFDQKVATGGNIITQRLLLLLCRDVDAFARSFFSVYKYRPVRQSFIR